MSFELIDLLNIAKRRWWLLVVTTVACGFAGHSIAAAKSPNYRAQTKLLVGPINGDIDTLRASSQLTSSYVDLALSRPLREQTRTNLRLPQLPASAISVAGNDLTRVLTIRADSHQPRTAAAIANTLASELRRLVPRRAGPEGRLTVIEPATAPDAAFGPRVGLITGLCAFAGFVLGALMILLLESVSDSVRDEEDLAQLAGAPVLERVEGLGDSRLVRRRPSRFDSALESPAAKPYHLLAAKIALSNGSRPSRLLLIGSDAADTIGSFAANLAAAVAHAGRRVVLVDADEQGEATRLLNLSDHLGLAELLNRQPSQGDGIVGGPFCATPSPRFHVIPRGAVPLDLREEGVRELLDRIASEADAVVVSASPLSRSPEALVWARATDAAVLVAYRDRTRRSSVVNASKSLRLVGADVAGIVLGTRTGRII